MKTMILLVLGVLFLTGVECISQLSMEDRTYALEMTVLDLVATVNELKGENAALKQGMTDMASENVILKRDVAVVLDESASLKETTAELMDEIATLRQQNAALPERSSSMEENNGKASDVKEDGLSLIPEPDTRSQFTAFACTQSMVNLACPGGRTIFVTSAVYGVYWTDSACTGCCPPNPGLDCTELVEENRPSDWLAIKAVCDNQTTCAFEVLVSGIDECEYEYDTNYMQLFYDCLQDDQTGPVAFTAYADTGSPTYANDDIIVFNEVLTNFGGHYNSATSSFICPADGVYVINAQVQLLTTSDIIEIHLMQNTVPLIGARISPIPDVNNHGGPTAITECRQGDMLWVRAEKGGTLWAGNIGYNAFSAFLLHRL